MTRVTLLDYGAGNVKSLYNALVALGCDVEQTDKPEAVASAAILFFPGVGAFGSCMAMLERKQLVEPLRAYIRAGRPFLGICLGMQTLFESSEESPGVAGLGVVPGAVGRFDVASHGLCVPQIGWNGVAAAQPSPLLGSLAEGDALYFVHSFRVPRSEAVAPWVLCETEYGDRFVSGVANGKVAAVQFHPEKSGAVGLALLGAFLASSTAEPPPRAVAAAAAGGGSTRPRLGAGKLSAGPCRRIVACLDVRANDAGDLVVTKGDQYDCREKGGGEVRNLGKPVALARRYYEEGADEVTFLNITGFRECPLTDLPMLKVLAEASRTCFVPLCVGGGIKDLVDAQGTRSSALQVADAYFRAGADKVSLGSDAAEAARAYLERGGTCDGSTSIEAISAKYGAQACVVSIDPRRVWVADAAAAEGHALADHAGPLGRGGRGPAGESLCWYECTLQGGRKGSGLDVVQVARAVEALGAGELLVNCIDCDGQHAGFDLPLMAMLKAAVSIPVIASSGAGAPEHFSEVFRSTQVEAALAASIFHRRTVAISAVKECCATAGFAVRAAATPSQEFAPPAESE